MVFASQTGAMRACQSWPTALRLPPHPVQPSSPWIVTGQPVIGRYVDDDGVRVAARLGWRVRVTGQDQRQPGLVEERHGSLPDTLLVAVLLEGADVAVEAVSDGRASK